MIEEAFQHRSGRVIAFGRSVLAIFFLLAIWLDHSQPTVAAPETYAILASYVAASVGLLLFTWNDWWLESRIGAAAHAADMLVFLWLNYATQGYASPFFTFFAFLIFAASIRWGWRGTAATAAIIIVLYVASGVTAASFGTEAFELRRFLLRSSYLVVLSAMTMLWLVATRQSSGAVADLAAEARAAGREMRPLLVHAAARFRAPRALFVWSEREEPWTYVSRLDGPDYEQVRLDPGRFDPAVSPELGEAIFLFEQRPGRVLAGPRNRRRARPSASPINSALAEHYGALRGLRIPMRSEAVTGDLLVLDVPGLCSDDLEIAEMTRDELAGALEHRELFHATEEAAEVRARLSLARDLHDSVVQFLAGLAFRLEGVKKRGAGGRGVVDEVSALQAELAREQQDLRGFIAELRGVPDGGPPSPDLAASLRELTQRISRQWGVACAVTSAPEAIAVSPSLEQNVRQLVREAVANAVRHGRATEIDTALSRGDGSLKVEIRDNGVGFPVAGVFDHDQLGSTGPTSLRERVHNLGGRLQLASDGSGSRLSIALPLDTRA